MFECLTEQHLSELGRSYQSPHNLDREDSFDMNKLRNSSAIVVGLIALALTACAGSTPTPEPTQTLPPPTNSPIPPPTSTPQSTATQSPSPIPLTATPDLPNVGTLTQTSDFKCTFEPADGPIPAGEVGITIVQETSNVNFVNLYRLSEDSTYEEFRAFIKEQGQSAGGPFEDVRQLEVKTRSTTTVYERLQPGAYAFVCIQITGSERTAFGSSPYPAGPFEIEE